MKLKENEQKVIDKLTTIDDNTFLLKKLRSVSIPREDYPEIERIFLVGSRAKDKQEVDDNTVSLVVKFKDLDINDYNNKDNSIKNYGKGKKLLEDIKKQIPASKFTKKDYDISLTGSYEHRKEKPDNHYFHVNFNPFK